MNDLSDAGFAALTAKIARDKGFGCASYKEKCLRRRIAVRMRARGVHTYADYARVLDSDTERVRPAARRAHDQRHEALSQLRDVHGHRGTRRPGALGAAHPQINVWSAGCSSGEEPYSLAALFHRHAERLGALAQLATRVRVLGSDIDVRCLLAAEAGRLPKEISPIRPMRSDADTSPQARPSRSSPKSAGSSASSDAISSLNRHRRDRIT